MTMILRDEHSTLQLGRAEPDTSGHDDVHLVVRASSRGFVGLNANIWVSRQIWNAFLDDLHQLVAKRIGEARLTSMSPAELEIRVRVRDRAGHVSISGFLGAYMVWSDLTDVARLPFRVEADPSNLAELADQFREFADSQR